jgi:hypothetical protein
MREKTAPGQDFVLYRLEAACGLKMPDVSVKKGGGFRRNCLEILFLFL